MKKLLSMAILLAVSWSSIAATPSAPCNNTFVKQVGGIGNQEPRIFKDPAASLFFLTSADNSSTYISGVNAAGTLTWTHNIKFMGDVGIIKDLVVDQIDGTLAGVVIGNNFNYIFKYNYVAASFNWIKSYPTKYVFQNIHQEAAGNYIVTGEIMYSNITIFEVDRNTGAFGSFQNEGAPFTGEFFSTYDGNNIYGACRYYSSGSLFNPSLYEFTPSGTNTWINTYVQNTATTARIYPVAPIVDKNSNSILQLSSGDDVGFNTYQTGPTKIWLLETDIAGNLNWTNEMIIPGYKQPNVKKIINTATGYYLLTDVFNGTIENYFFVIKTDKAGKVQWSNRYGIKGGNSVISGVEDKGYLYLTALSQSYTASMGILLLKLNANGMSEAACPYIRPWNVYHQSYTNTQANKPPGISPTGFSNANHTASIASLVASDKVHCYTTCPTSVPCNTLTGSLASNVMAFYPFGNGSLLDLSGNGNNLNNSTTAYATMDRSGNPTCAYHFERTLGDFLNGPGTFFDNITTATFSISLWYQPTYDPTRRSGDYELLLGRGNTGLHCPDNWGEWSAGLFDCRKAVVGFDQLSHWENDPARCAAFAAGSLIGWHHLTFVYDPSALNPYILYIDAVPYINNQGPCGPISGNIGQLMLGVDYSGDLDDVIIYNKALTASDVSTLMGLKGSCCDGISSSAKKAPLEKASGLRVYPNPSDDKVSVSSSKENIRQINVYTNTGMLAGTYTFDAAEVSVHMDHFAPGIYFIKVTTDEGTFIEKVVRQ